MIESGTVSNNDVGVSIYKGSGNTLSEIHVSSNGGTGISLNMTDSNTLTHCDVSNNSGGIELQRSNNNRIDRVNAFSNVVGPGIWLLSSSQNTVSNFAACNNTSSGIYIGCSPTFMPAKVTCVPFSGGDGNVVASGVAQSNDVGIGIDSGNHNNRVLSTDSVNVVAATPCNGKNSPGDDLQDVNANCDSNLWAMNIFASVSPASCIH